MLSELRADISIRLLSNNDSDRVQSVGADGANLETMDYLEFIARVTSHISDKGQATIEIAAQPEVYYRRGKEGRFMGWSGYLPRRKKSNFLSRS